MPLFGSATRPAMEHSYFFALSPGNDVRQQLSVVADELDELHRFNGSRVRGERYHLTLHHLGHLPEIRQDRVSRAIAAANNIKAKPFEIVLDQFMCFDSKTGKFPCVVTSEKESPALEKFWLQLRNNLIAVRWDGIVDEHFRPHVTLFRNRQPIAGTHSVSPIRWCVSDFVLFRSEAGRSEYVELGRWPLQN